jgi:hypothetical protein
MTTKRLPIAATHETPDAPFGVEAVEAAELIPEFATMCLVPMIHSRPIKCEHMRIATPEILSYFASLQTRIDEATLVPFRAVSVADWKPKPAECHKNVDCWNVGHENRARVRGWLTWGNDEFGSCHLIAHSVVDENAVLYDITPIDPNTPPPMFLRHIGEQESFDKMLPQWSWTTYPIIFELSDESGEIEEDAGYN